MSTFHGYLNYYAIAEQFRKSLPVKYRMAESPEDAAQWELISRLQQALARCQHGEPEPNHDDKPKPKPTGEQRALMAAFGFDE